MATLGDLAASGGWIAEEPELHLLPHLEAATATGPLAIRATTTDSDGTFVVELAWVAEGEPRRRDVRAALFVLIGTIAESITVIHEVPAEGGRRLEVLTGLVGADSPFATHGHTVRLRVTAASDDDAS